jgi:hypothetical protein
MIIFIDFSFYKLNVHGEVSVKYKLTSVTSRYQENLH